MKKTLVSLMITLVITFSGFGQSDYVFSKDSLTNTNLRNIILSADIGTSFDENEVLQSNLIGQSFNLHNQNSFEFLLGVRIWNSFYAELGVANRPLLLGYSISHSDSAYHLSSSSTRPFDAVVVPVRCQYFFPLEGSPVSLFVYGGAKLVFLSEDSSEQIGGSFFAPEVDGSESTVQTTAVIEREKGMVLNMGLAATLDLTPGLAIVARAEYDCGLMPMARLYVRYNIGDGSVNNSIFNYASGYRFSAGLQFRL